MRLDLLDPPLDDAEVVTVDDAEAHVRAPGFEDGLAIKRMVRTASQIFEEETGRQVLTATWRLFLERFPAGREPIAIPKPPLQEVVQVRYRDADGGLVVWDSAEYEVIAPSGVFARAGFLFPAVGKNYPHSRWTPDGVQVDFRAGWGDPDDVPEAVRDTILGMVTGLYEIREPQILGTTSSANRGFDRLLSRFRLPVMA